MEKGIITVRQFVILVSLTVIGDSLLVMPGILSTLAFQDAWLSAIIGLLLGVPVIGVYCVAARCYPKLNLIEKLQKVFGKWIGALLSLLFLFHTLITSGVVLREAGDFIVTHTLPQTPMYAVVILLSIIVAMAIKLGVESFMRTAELLIPVFVLFFLFFCLALLPQINFKELLPIYNNGFLPIARGTFISVTFTFVEASALLMITPYVKREGAGTLSKSFMIGAIFGGLVLIVVTVLTITVLGPHMTERQMYPSYTLAKKISIGNFIERLEAVIAIMWLITNFFKTLLHAFALNAGLSNLLRLDDYRLLVYPLTIIVLVVSLAISPNIVYFNIMLTRIWPFFDMAFAFGIPLLLIIGYAFRQGVGLISKSS